MNMKQVGLRDAYREKTLQRNENRRIPTVHDFVAFDGALPADLLPAPRGLAVPGVPAHYQVLRWILLFPKSPAPYEGWAGGYHEHHDHRAEIGFAPRFERTVRCEQCKSADATAKRKLKLPKQFSFSPDAIAQFVIATPHGWRLHDYDRAAQIYAVVQAVAPVPHAVFWPPIMDRKGQC